MEVVINATSARRYEQKRHPSSSRLVDHHGDPGSRVDSEGAQAGLACALAAAFLPPLQLSRASIRQPVTELEKIRVVRTVDKREAGRLAMRDGSEPSRSSGNPTDLGLDRGG